MDIEQNISIESLKERGNTFFKTQNYPEAIKTYTEALKIEPTHAIILSNRAACYLAQ